MGRDQRVAELGNRVVQGAGKQAADPRGRWLGELSVPSYELFSQTEILGRMALDRMLAELSTRRYPVGLATYSTVISH